MANLQFKDSPVLINISSYVYSWSFVHVRSFHCLRNDYTPRHSLLQSHTGLLSVLQSTKPPVTKKCSLLSHRISSFLSSSISDLHLHLFYFHITVQITSSGSSDFLLLSPILTVWHHTVYNCCTYLSCNFFHLLVIFFNVYLLLPGLNSKFENPHLYSPLYFPVLGAQ